MAVLAGADGPMKLEAIHRAVQEMLDGPVSLDSVGSYLRINAKGARARFGRPSYGHYVLITRG